MNYLISQMWLCLLLAALLGAVIGYWLAKCSSQSKLDELEADWRNKLDEQDHSQVIKEINKSNRTNKLQCSRAKLEY